MAGAPRAVVISSPKAAKRRSVLVIALRRAGFHVMTPEQSRPGSVPDLVIAIGSMAVLPQVRSMRAVAPQVPIFVTWLDHAAPRFVTAAYAAGATSVVPAGRVDVAWRNLSRLIGSAKGPEPAERAQPIFVPAFHDGSGRLDASRIAAAMGLTLAQLAKAIRMAPSALARRPNAVAAQAGLREMEFCWAALLDMLGEPDLARAWLHAGHPDFSGKSPLQSLTDGGAKRLGNYLRAAMAGDSA